MMKETLLKKITEMANRGIEIRKELSFNLEDLQDNSNICIAEVLEYLTEHADKIEDYWLEYYVSEHSFKPTLILHMKLNEESETLLFGKEHDGHTSNPSSKSWLDLVKRVKRAQDTPLFKDNLNFQ